VAPGGQARAVPAAGGLSSASAGVVARRARPTAPAGAWLATSSQGVRPPAVARAVATAAWAGSWPCGWRLRPGPARGTSAAPLQAQHRAGVWPAAAVRAHGGSGLARPGAWQWWRGSLAACAR